MFQAMSSQMAGWQAVPNLKSPYGLEPSCHAVLLLTYPSALVPSARRYMIPLVLM